MNEVKHHNELNMEKSETYHEKQSKLDEKVENISSLVVTLAQKATSYRIQKIEISS